MHSISKFPFGQQNKDELIKEAEEKLKTNKATISQILTDKKYDAIHPETSFRNLIEKYCKAGTISIATDTIPGKKIKVIGSVKDARRQTCCRCSGVFISNRFTGLVCC